MNVTVYGDQGTVDRDEQCFFPDSGILTAVNYLLQEGN